MKFLRRKEEGFTLIEVMLVVIIIGIIAVIALPKLLVTRDTAAEKSCLSNLQALKTVVEQYKWDMGTYPPATCEPTTAGVLQELIDHLQTTAGTDGKTFLPPNADVSRSCPGDGVYDYDSATGAITCGGTDGHAP